jgi:hypothetical protein
MHYERNRQTGLFVADISFTDCCPHTGTHKWSGLPPKRLAESGKRPTVNSKEGRIIFTPIAYLSSNFLFICHLHFVTFTVIHI